jgi:hypothetical protein
MQRHCDWQTTTTPRRLTEAILRCMRDSRLDSNDDDIQSLLLPLASLVGELSERTVGLPPVERIADEARSTAERCSYPISTADALGLASRPLPNGTTVGGQLQATAEDRVRGSPATSAGRHSAAGPAASARGLTRSIAAIG